MSQTPPVVRLLPESWRVQLPVFEGPLDLLLHLVRINEVDIKDIPVAKICDQFHEYLRLMEELDLDIAAEYIYEAALLIQLKSKLLLPRPKRADGTEIEEDPRQELVTRLLEYRIVRLMPNDIPTWAAVPVLILAVGIMAAMWPALRASRVDPNVALREL